MHHSSRTLATAAVFALLGAGCSSSTEPFTDPDALAAAQTFDRIADSLSTAGADAGVSDSYRQLARVLQTGPRVSSVFISVDGVPAEFLATAQSFDLNYCPPQGACALILRPPLNSMVAWQRSNPRRIVQLTADASFLIGTPPVGYVDVDPFLGRATLTYLDGAGGVYVGTGGSQSIAAAPTDEPCAAPSRPVEAIYAMPPVQCRAATFIVSFDGTVQPPPFALRNNTASGSHSIAMAEQTVAGTQLVTLPCGTCSVDTPLLRPPVTVGATSSMLLPALRATVTATDVTLAFTVKNISTVPVRIEFNGAQQYDFIVRSAATNAVVWQWSAQMGFARPLTSRTLAAGETALYTEHWPPTASGVYTAQAFLTSSSHRATSFAVFGVP